MSRIVLSGLVQDMSGSAGSYVYSKWKGLHYIRLKAATVTNPNTTHQATIRNSLACVARGWSSLSAVDRALWAARAVTAGFPRNKEKKMGSGQLAGTRGRLFSGMNAQVASNTLLSASGGGLGFTFVTVPPLYKASTPLTLTCGFLPNPTKNLGIAGTFSPALKDSRVLIFFKATEKGASKYLIKSVTVAPSDSAFDVTDLFTVRTGHGVNIQEVTWEEKYGFTGGPNAGKIIGYLQYKILTSDGDVGSCSATIPVVY